MKRFQESPLFDPLDPINDFLSGNNLLRVAQSMMKALSYIIFYYLKGFLTKILFETKKALLVVVPLTSKNV